MLAALLLGGCQSTSEENRKPAEVTAQETENKDTQVKTGYQVFGEFTSYTQQGEEVSQEIFSQADLTMVNIWGTFCTPCISEMPDLGELAQEYADQGLAIVGIISDVQNAGDETAQEIIDATGADYTHIVLSQELYEKRLTICRDCPNILEGMCRLCGCFVELRAALKVRKCPDVVRRW